jgi:hypothetical protein
MLTIVQYFHYIEIQVVAIGVLRAEVSTGPRAKRRVLGNPLF